MAGPLSWRKAVTFGVSFGIAVLSVCLLARGGWCRARIVASTVVGYVLVSGAALLASLGNL